jgi:hypothetical protein
MTDGTAAEIRSSLEAAFRERVGGFYRSLQITPPYHSVEQAALALRDALAPLSLTALQALTANESELGRLFAQIVRESGLAKKHRKIIKGLLIGRLDRLPAACRPLADAYRD